MEDALICTLHMENRIELTTVNLLFLEGKGNYNNELILNSLSYIVIRRMKEYSSVTDTINNEIVGSKLYLLQWIFPLSKNQKGIGTSRLDNNRRRYIIQNISSLIDIFIIN